jgi:DNA-directed RNA polymerase subunit RPC12/RpoP
MDLICPSCGSRNLRHSRTKSPLERLLKVLQFRMYRCRDCKERFKVRTWRLSELKYARCPKCFALDLNRWTPQPDMVANYVSILLHMGANPYRCEYCGRNFLSFRDRKYRFVPKLDEESQQRLEDLREGRIPPPFPMSGSKRSGRG